MKLALGMLFTIPAASGGLAAALALRGRDIYAVVGLVAGLALLTIWVFLENLRRTRRQLWQLRADQAPGASGVSAASVTALHAADTPEMLVAPGMAGMARTTGMVEVPGSLEPDMSPVPARPEWLLEDNTLLRIGVVKRSALRRRPVPSPVAVADPATISIAPSTARTSPPRVSGTKTTRPLRIAMMGTRGIPANYSGFETCVEQLSVRLAERGHQVTVYCRSHHVNWRGNTYKGVRLVKLPTIARKHTDTIVHTFLSMAHGQFRRYDVVYVFGVGNAPLALIPRLAGQPTAINVDGADWERDKWGGFAKHYLQFSERMAAKFATCIVADSHVIERYYESNFQAPSIYVPYGSQVRQVPPGDKLRQLGLQPDGYILFVGRLVPENNAHDVIEAYRQLGGLATGLQLCIVGDAPYSSDYKAELKQKAGPGVVFAGYVFGDGYHELGSNARLVAFSSGVGGTHPALLEAMAFGNCVVVNDMAANMETAGDAAIPYASTVGASDLARVMAEVIANPALVDEYRQRAAYRARTVYSWDVVADHYEDLFSQLARRA